MVPIPNGYKWQFGNILKRIVKSIFIDCFGYDYRLQKNDHPAQVWTLAIINIWNCWFQHGFWNCFFGFVFRSWCFPHEKLFVLLIWWSGERSWLSDNSWKVFWSSGKCFAYISSSRICWFSFPYILTNRYFDWLESCLLIFPLTS